MKYKSKLKKWLLRCTLIVVCAFVLFLLLHWIFPLPDNIQYSTVVTDRNGEIIHTYLTPDEKWRLKTELDEISPLLRKTIIAKEDQYFYSHPGVNPLAVGRAMFSNIFSGKRVSGASTITMQVARALERRPRTWGNKFIEMFRALQLEWKYSKDEILQLYLNLVPYGGNIEGVKSASWIYFNKAPDHLSLAEITALSIIPNRPSSLVMGRNNDLIITERNRWLNYFREEGLFTEKEIADALLEPLDAYRRELPRMAPHLSQKLRYSDRHEIQSSIDLNTQLKTEKLVADFIRSQRLRGIRNAAAVVVDNSSMEVVAYVGSADFADTIDAGQVNGAKAIRQPGSTLKPLIYALGFDEGIYTPKTIVTDVPVYIQGYSPENYDKQYTGYVSIEYALEHSLNIPAVKALRRVGIESLVNALVIARFKQIEKDRRKLGLSVALGGCGTTLEELTGLYASFANAGRFRPLVFENGKKSSVSRRLVSEEAAYMIHDILTKVNRPDFPLNWTATERMPRIAWKTGTSYGRRDAWSIGYNKKYTIGVWVGNFSGVGVPDLSGAQTATPLLFRLFNTIDYDTDEGWFAPPKNYETRMVCSESGLVPGDFCKNLITDAFIPLLSNTKACEHLQEIKISADESVSYCASCAPATGFKKKVYRILEPEMQAWMAERNRPYEKIPPHNPGCERVFRENGPIIQSPLPNNEYLISKNHPEPLMLLAKTGNDVSRVFWYINDQFYKSAAPEERQFFMPPEGRVKISCTDDKGRNSNVVIQVKFIGL